MVSLDFIFTHVIGSTEILMTEMLYGHALHERNSADLFTIDLGEALNGYGRKIPTKDSTSYCEQPIDIPARYTLIIV